MFQPGYWMTICSCQMHFDHSAALCSVPQAVLCALAAIQSNTGRLQHRQQNRQTSEDGKGEESMIRKSREVFRVVLMSLYLPLDSMLRRAVRAEELRITLHKYLQRQSISANEVEAAGSISADRKETSWQARSL